MSERNRIDQDEAPRVVVRDRRRIDPDGTVREVDPEPQPEPAGAGAGDPVPDPAGDTAALRTALDERTADLQRVKAEYDNYRRRVERDRLAVVEQATAGVLAQLLPVLDDVDRAREHGEVVGGFKSVADALEGSLAKLGLQRLGEPGDPFDPLFHEAVTHQISADVEAATCVAVMRPGYAFGERLLRPAMVAVAEPPEAEPPEAEPADAEPAQDATPEE